VVSPRSYFVFTPLLNDAAVGTLEFRTTLEPVRRRNSGVSFLQGWADDVDFAERSVTVEPSTLDPDVGHALTGERHGNQSIQPVGHTVPTFKVNYDKLIIAVGCYSQTFGTKGVKENALFLKDVGDARKIRRRILELFEMAGLPATTEKVRNDLLHFAIVGGGPTGMEFAAQLCDLVQQDLRKLYPGLTDYVRISLYDVAPKVLPMFDATLADWAVRNYKRQGIEIKTSHHVEELRQGFPNEGSDHPEHKMKGGVYTLRTREEGDIGIGMCVWSTGNMMNPFVRKALDTVHEYPTKSAEITAGEAKLADQKQWIIERDAKTGSILVDERLRVQIQTQYKDREAVMKDVWCVGDVAKLASGALPATAQVANQQAIWLAKRLNKNDFATHTFGFHNLGIMTYVGNAKAMFQGGSTDRRGKAQGLKGWTAFLLWRGAYLTMTLSWRNKILVPMYWIVNRIFGRDITRF
jgi:NADH dehydrogenase FAD-containing subunit